MVCALTQPSYQWRHDFSKLADGSQNVTALLRHLSTLVNLHRSKVIRWSEHLPQAMLIEPSGPLPHLLLLQSANLVPSLLSSAELTLYSMAAHNVLILIHRPFLILAGLKMTNSVETYKLSTALAEKSSSICSDSSAEISSTNITHCAMLCSWSHTSSPTHALSASATTDRRRSVKNRWMMRR